ncbi:bifunctional 4-hydroxy-2-oxoglutarate aldolase/2-dehydro-3-deoxy-phosphogluconate aldolase [Allonocardiopsis opalescens]|uniref:2-keto-3-deoxy-phosphogluconate aldolase n=1 Tax=Allonocardiopsis opalescens TaxID=1144618 RepID=A0A2T0QA66_9ACTN|nr:bifunctional 4-hydroxy-2-oxoglutarate aldolase/2-dehydro-3-deoxy-phosphogluconate aldolase [Allonocardiopsis opalescens]PRY00806.1 2-keto-3-deoxy-phosphogluconate aldolase [Allonocardiopsis opalescens]
MTTAPENPSGFDAIFGDRRVMAILRGMPPGQTVELAQRAWDLGIEQVEVPVQTPDALPSLAAAVAAARERGRDIGAGTVTTVEQVRAVAAAGAVFTVAPGFDPAVAAASAAAGLPHLPGVATPTEVQQAVRHGLSWLKMFPATALGTAWFSAMRGPFPAVRLVATGGVDARNAAEYFAAGARVVAVGSALADPEQLDLLAPLVRA